VVLFALLIGHAFADYPLQGEFLAKCKNRKMAAAIRDEHEHAPVLLWFHCLTAHALIHAGFVWLVSGVVLLGIVEFVLHWIIDFMKSEGWINFQVDQSLHVLCKVGYVIVIYQELPGFS